MEPPEGDREMERFVAFAQQDAPPSDPDEVTVVRLTGPLFFADADSVALLHEPGQVLGIARASRAVLSAFLAAGGTDAER